MWHVSQGRFFFFGGASPEPPRRGPNDPLSNPPACSTQCSNYTTHAKKITHTQHDPGWTCGGDMRIQRFEISEGRRIASRRPRAEGRSTIDRRSQRGDTWCLICNFSHRVLWEIIVVLGAKSLKARRLNTFWVKPWVTTCGRMREKGLAEGVGACKFKVFL
jgi:hypothetical protein